MSPLIAAHAFGASLALLLGAYNLRRAVKGDSLHRRAGMVWTCAMYWTVLSSFAIRELRPGHLSWIHGLSVFTFVTLSVGLWAGYTGHGRVHGRMMAGSYFGLVGAFIGAVAVPQRAVPQMVLHQPLILVAAVAVCLVVAVAIVRWARTGPRRRRTMPRQKSRVEAVIHATATNSAGNQP